VPARRRFSRRCGQLRNRAKEKFLGVRAETLRQHGAVSEAVAREMAAGARENSVRILRWRSRASPALAAARRQAGGTVFIALASAAGVVVDRRLNPWDRATFKEVTATQALEQLRTRLIYACARRDCNKVASHVCHR